MSCNFKTELALFTQQSVCRLPALLWAAMMGLYGCNTAYVTGVSFSGMSQASNTFCDASDPALRAQCTPQLLESLKFAERGKPIVVDVTFGGATGSCNVKLDFGDGTPPVTQSNFDVTIFRHIGVPHTYNGWPGKKLVHVTATSTECLGDKQKEITVGIRRDLMDFRIGFKPTSQICAQGLNIPRLRKGSVVRMRTNGMTINYGGNAVFNASGDPSAPVPPGYLFPNHRKYSLVYRIGAQMIQGEAGPVIFTVAATGDLEICVNDNPNFLQDNTGGMAIDVFVNEHNAQ